MANIEEFERVGLGLERWHGIFNQLWGMGYPQFSKNIPTAAVGFNRKGQFVQFMFNPDFWDSLSKTEREFVICHECLHVLRDHGKRFRDASNKYLGNLAADVVVNHSLIQDFDFDRDNISIQEHLIWKDTLFPHPDKIEDNREFEYYYSKLEDIVDKIKQNLKTLDQHEFMSGEGNSEGKGKESLEPIPDNILERMVNKAREKLSHEENEKLNRAGVEVGSEIHKVNYKEKRRKQAWEKIVQIWTHADIDIGQTWTKKSRRHAILPDNFILPNNDRSDSIGKINMWFFQDTSGSCRSMADDFFNATRTFPKHKFNIRMFGFSTDTYEINPDNPHLKGFGGTRFDIIEECIQSKVKSTKCTYPDAVFIFTDGCGNSVQPQYSERWYWFLSRNDRYCIPKKSKVFMLRDFVE